MTLTLPSGGGNLRILLRGARAPPTPRGSQGRAPAQAAGAGGGGAGRACPGVCPPPILRSYTSVFFPQELFFPLLIN